MRVVLDTNILVSALFWEGNERDLVSRCFSGDLRSVTSPTILSELERVLVHKFNTPENDVLDYIIEIMAISDIVTPPGELSVVETDPDDDMVLETASIGDADMIITGDVHLLTLNRYEDVDIIGAKDLIERTIRTG